MPGPGELLGAGKAGRPPADTRHALAGPFDRRLGHDPALVPSPVDDRAFDRLDGHRLIDDVERARRLAWSGADASGEFREVVRGMEDVERIPPVRLVDEVVPVGDQVVHRTPVVTVRDAAIHAPGRLQPQVGLGMRDHEFLVVADALLWIGVCAILAFVFEEAGFLAHDPYSAATVAASSRSASSCLSARA